jgi:hypothetical protein
MLGDWLRHNCVAIGWEEDTSQGKAFPEEIRKGDSITVVSDDFVWALGVL